ncbi:MAG: hypothetical protein KF795_12310 [Labilithrix sp.]|nr:hypothetical protein [Labilithrix sp.]
MSRLAALTLVLGSVLLGACAVDADDDVESNEDAIVSRKVDDHWFYSGPLPALQSPSVTASLAGHTAHVTGYLPAGTQLPNLPHVKTKAENGKLRVDVVYPIATAKAGKSNSRPGTYSFHSARPYRPNGAAFTQSEGWHDVPWGGFPFIAYNGGIAFHGPITDQDNEAPGDLNVWYLRRGQVSAGCNRMMGEHVVEMAHILGISMRKVYPANTPMAPTTNAKVKVLADYDTYDGKYIDVDYPTDSGAKRPASVHGADKVVMFGSWVATEMPDGKDLPPNMKWAGGVSGRYYDFSEHAVRGHVCSMPRSSLAALKPLAAARPGAELPADFCAKKIACDDRLGRTCTPAEIGF